MILDPLLVDRRILPRHDEELYLHLFQLTDAEDEIARRNLVAERFADLGDAERELPVRRIEDVLEVDEHPLCRLRAKIGERLGIRDWADLRFEHQVECARRR